MGSRVPRVSEDRTPSAGLQEEDGGGAYSGIQDRAAAVGIRSIWSQKQ